MNDVNKSMTSEVIGEIENSDGEQYLTFFLTDEEYGINILKVQEIKSWCKVTPLPDTEEYLLGVINLRGTVVPIVDLRLRFELKPQYDSTTAIIVCRIIKENQTRIVGIVVDNVSEVYNIAENSINHPPELGATITAKYLHGLITVEKQMIILLDLERLIEDSLFVSTADAIAELSAA